MLILKICNILDPYLLTLYEYSRAVRQAIKSQEPAEVQAAILAVHLGMLDEAEQILIQAQRFVK